MVRPSPPKGKQDIWTALERSANIGAAPTTTGAATTPVPKAKPTMWGKARRRIWFTCLDITGAALWIYVLLKLFVFDIDRVLFHTDTLSADFIIKYRVIFPAVLMIIFALFFWRWKFIWSAVYISFFPIIFAVWKGAKLFIRFRLYRNSILIMALINSCALAVHGVRYQIISKCAAIIAVVLILSTHAPIPALFGGVVMLLLLMSATFRVFFQAFRTRTFVTSQRKLISFLSRYVEQPPQLDASFQPDGTLTKEQATKLAMTIQIGAIVNRLLYVWAYKLQQYRESNIVLLFNGISFTSLFLGAAIAFSFANLALLKCDPGQFYFQSSPSLIAVFLYSLSSLAFADGGGITAHGDISYFLRILAGIYGPSFLLTIVVNSILTLRQSREGIELEGTIADLKKQARRHEAMFRDAVRVGFSEACDRLLQYGLCGMSVFINWLGNAIPPGFVDEVPGGFEAALDPPKGSTGKRRRPNRRNRD